MQRSKLSGRELTTALHSSLVELADKAPGKAPIVTRDIAETIKHTLCDTALDFEKEAAAVRPVRYTLPDGEILELGKVRHQLAHRSILCVPFPLSVMVEIPFWTTAGGTRGDRAAFPALARQGGHCRGGGCWGWHSYHDRQGACPASPRRTLLWCADVWCPS